MHRQDRLSVSVRLGQDAFAVLLMDLRYACSAVAGDRSREQRVGREDVGEK